MPVTLSSLKKRTGTLTMFDEQGDEDALHLTYYLIGEDTIDELLTDEKDTRTPEERIRETAAKLKDTMPKWDLTDDDKQPIPVEVDALCATVPFDLMLTILNRIRRERLNPN